jgi:hypothetical protein
MQLWKSVDYRHQTSVIVKPNINVFAVYVGLTASGYNLAQYSCDEPIYDIVRKIKDFRWLQQIQDYFAFARTNTCEVNPYWPRAYLLTFSSLYISDKPDYRYIDTDRVIRSIKELSMISPADKQQNTVSWLMEFPEIYTAIRSQPMFEVIWNAYLKTINISQCENEAFESLASIVDQVDINSNQLPKIIIVPNPLQASEVTDFATINSDLYIIKAQPDSASITHEILHYLFESNLESCKIVIGKFHHLLGSVLDKMIRLQYEWADDIPSWNRVFEENLMRAASIWIACQNDIIMAQKAADYEADYGFAYVPIIFRQFTEKWKGMKDFTIFIQECLKACESKGVR